MSYCRWSTDDFQCDVYVYEAREGWVTHVAGNRVVWDVALPADVDFTVDIDGFFRRHQDVYNMLEDESTHHRIALPREVADRSFTHDSPGDCADNLERLRSLGCTVPGDVITVLREEEREREQEAING